MQSTKEFQRVVPDFAVWKHFCSSLRDNQVTATDLELASLKGYVGEITNKFREIQVHNQTAAEAQGFRENLAELQSDHHPETYVARVQAFVPSLLAMRGKIPEECLGLISRALFQTQPREYLEEASRQLETFCAVSEEYVATAQNGIKKLAERAVATLLQPKLKEIPEKISQLLQQLQGIFSPADQVAIDTEKAHAIIEAIEAQCSGHPQSSKSELIQGMGTQSILERAHFCDFARAMSRNEAHVGAALGRWKKQLEQVEMLREDIHWRVEQSSGDLENRPEEVKKFAASRQGFLELRIKNWNQGEFLDALRLLCEGHVFSIQESLAVRELLFSRCDLAPEWWPLVGLMIPKADSDPSDFDLEELSSSAMVERLKAAITEPLDRRRQVDIIVRIFPALAFLNVSDKPQADRHEAAWERDGRIKVLFDEFGLTPEYAGQIADLPDSDIKIIGVEEELRSSLHSWLSNTHSAEINPDLIFRALCTQPWDVFTHSLEPGFREWCQEIGRLMYCLAPLGQEALLEYLTAVQSDPESMATVRCATPVPNALTEYVNGIERISDSLQAPEPSGGLNGQLQRLLPSYVEGSGADQAHAGGSNGTSHAVTMRDLLGEHIEAKLRLLEAIAQILPAKTGKAMEFDTIQRNLETRGFTPGKHTLGGLLESLSSRGLFIRTGRNGYGWSDGTKIVIPDLKTFFERFRGSTTAPN